MLHILLKWKTYRTLKNGLLLDYSVKRSFYQISKFFTQTFTIFFGDKYLLEHLFSNLYKFLAPLGFFIKNLNKNSFIKFFRVTILIIFYLFILVTIVFIL